MLKVILNVYLRFQGELNSIKGYPGRIPIKFEGHYGDVIYFLCVLLGFLYFWVISIMNHYRGSCDEITAEPKTLK